MFRAYLIAQLKKVKKLIPTMFLMTLVLGGTLLIMASVLMQPSQQNTEKKSKVRVGLVGNIEDTYLGFGIVALQNLDSSRFSIDFVSLTEEEASAGINDGTLNAYVIIPDGFIDSLMTGENKKATYVTSTGGVGLGSIVMNELVDTISLFLTKSQSAIYSSQSIMRDYEIVEDFWPLSDSLYFMFLDFLMGRSATYEMDIIGFTGTLSFIQYYFCALLILFLLFWGIAASPVFIGKDRAIEKLLISKGQSVLGQVVAEFIGYFVLLSASLFLVIFLLSFKISDLGFMETGELFLFYVKILPVVALVSAMQLMVFEFIQNMVSGILMQFMCCLGLGYVSGCFYPISFFPESIRLLQPFLPTGAAVNYAGACLSGEGFLKSFLIMAFYLIGFFAIMVFIRKTKQGGHR